jgi:hypothetical protein
MTPGGWTDGDSDIVALDEHSALCLAARDAGSPLWQALVDGTSYEKLVEALTAQYAARPDDLGQDVDELFVVLDERGLLNW